MQTDISNRMMVPGKRGRPSNAELAARLPPIVVAEVMVTPEPIQLPPIAGISPCPCCGRAMVPKIIRVTGNERTVACAYSGRLMIIAYDKLGKPATAVLI